MAKIAEEEKKLFNGQVLYREWGRRFTTLQQYLKGIHYYELSTEHGDDNFLWTLLGLSEALKQSGQFEKAAQVAEKCMSIDPSHLGAYYTRMEALFDIAEFCESLVYAHRGLRRRRHFKNAVLLANGTVDNCVGANVSADVVRQLQPWIAQLEAHRRDLLDKLNEEEDEFEGIDEDQDKFKVDDPEARLVERHRKLDRRMASLYLGPSCSDKGFLKGLVRHRALPSANKGGSVLLVAETRDFLDRLQSQQDALRTRKPLYVVRAQARAALTVARLEENWREVLLRRCLARRMAYFMLRGLHEARLCRDYPSFFRLVERARDRMEELGDWLLPGREMFLEGLYRMVARAYLDPRNLQRLCGESEARQEAYLRRALGLRLRGKLPRDSELAWPRCLDVRAALDKCRWRLALASGPLEILWIFHELCKHFLQIRRYDLARFYSKKARDLGLESGHEEWVLNANHILLRIELAQMNKPEAKEAAVVALESARKLGVDFLVDFYERAVEYVDQLDFGHGHEDDGIGTRVNKMLGLAPDDLRPRLRLLLRAMDAVPANRRLSVMPGCKPKDSGMPSNKPSVAPRPPGDMEAEARRKMLRKYAPSKRILGLIDFDDYD